MKLFHPFMISSRLLPSIKIVNATISIEDINVDDQGKKVYKFYIDILNQKAYESSDLRGSVCGNESGHPIQEVMESLLNFLSASAEAYSYPDSDNRDLFPEYIMEWAYQNKEEIEIAFLEMNEGPQLIFN